MHTSIASERSARALVQGFLFAVFSCLFPVGSFATPTDLPEVLERRGKQLLGQGTEQPKLVLTKPTGGWTAGYMLEVAGECSDTTVDPVIASINGVRYYIRTANGAFSRKFPAARGQNSVTVECANRGGTAKITRTITGVMNPIRLKIVLTSDTDGVYTDLHMYEPSGAHVYWAKTESPSGGMFFLNQQGDSGDQPGYGPYLYVHPAPPVGVFRIDTNYWPGGAVQHTLASLDVVTDEGLPSESRRRVRKPLARPGETQTLAYVVVRPNGQPISLYVPGQDDPEKIPEEVVAYQRDVEPKLKQQADDGYAYLPHSQEMTVRNAVVQVAMSQSKRASPSWIPSQRDCAGLVRFAYKEAVEPRTTKQVVNVTHRQYFPAMSVPATLFIPSFPRLWQTGFSKAGYPEFDFFADAETLVSYNFRSKGRTLELARPGDILAFQKDLTGDQPYHLMIFAGPDMRRGVVVYHTGSEGPRTQQRAGHILRHEAPSVRVVSLAELSKAPDPVWIPDQTNPHFMGVFEWKRFKPQDEGDAPFVRS